jgi:hypothetical protein
MRGYAGLQIANIGYTFITMENPNRTRIPSTAESEVGCSAVKKQVVPHDKGKPSERRGRKGTGLRLEMAIIAGLPKEESVMRLFLDAIRRETGFLVR